MNTTTHAEWVITNSQEHVERDESLVGKEINTSYCDCSRYSFENYEGVRVTTGCNRTTGSSFAQGHDAKLKSLLIAAGERNAKVEEKYFVGTGDVTVVVDTLQKGDRTKTVTNRYPAVDTKHRETTIEAVAGQYNFLHLVKSGVRKAQMDAKLKEARRTARANKRQIKADLLAERAAKRAANKAEAKKLLKEASDEIQAAKAEKAANSDLGEVKVGRWWYPVVARIGDVLVYNTKQGESKRVNGRDVQTR